MTDRLAETDVAPLVPRTDLGRELLELRKKAVEELRTHGESLLALEAVVLRCSYAID